MVKLRGLDCKFGSPVYLVLRVVVLSVRPFVRPFRSSVRSVRFVRPFVHPSSFLASPCGGSSICFFVPGTNGTGGDVTAITTYKIAAVILSCILFYSYNKLSFIYSLNYLRDACMILRSKFSTCY
eukprot:SAG11_NODE_818_length_7018_cov_10.501373_4_plen_125_part_00